MAWDFALDPVTHDLSGAVVFGDDEVMQRLWVRLNKELGEWFLNIDSGIPWYQSGHGILGSKPSRKNDIDLVLRQVIQDTEGIAQIVYFKSIYAAGSRTYTANIKIQLQSQETRTFDITADMADMEFYISGEGWPVPKIRASAITFVNGKSLQEMYDEGLLQGPVGPAGAQGARGPQGVPGSQGPAGKDGSDANIDVIAGQTNTINVGTTTAGGVKTFVLDVAGGVIK